jgi:thymidine phosphorylase
VVECIETLNGNGPADLEELVVVQSGQMLLQSGVVDSRAEGISMCKEVRGFPSGCHMLVSPYLGYLESQP